MKKLIIAAASVAMAIGLQAGQIKWSTTTGLVAAGSTTEMANDVVLEMLAVTSGTAFSTVWASVRDDTYTAIKNATTGSDGKITAQTFDYTDGKYDFYTVCVDGDNFFISNAATAKTVSTTGSASYGAALKSMSNSGTLKDVAAGAAGAGWYTTVPEPTSGLLLLLGMAGLALRRRRA